MKLTLLKNGALIVNSDFCRQNTGAVLPAGLVIEETGEGALPDLAGLADELNKTPVMDDAMAAVLVHGALHLPRREAARREFWHYLAIGPCRPYVVNRWFDTGKNQVTRSRYLGGWWDNAIGRLWWIAELTVMEVDGQSDYSLTGKVAADAETYQQLIDLTLSRSSVMVGALAAEIFPASGPKLTGDNIKALFKSCNTVRSACILDALDETEATRNVKELAVPLHKKK